MPIHPSTHLLSLLVSSSLPHLKCISDIQNRKTVHDDDDDDDGAEEEEKEDEEEEDEEEEEHIYFFLEIFF